MYATILTSIETGEYTWESNFDRFETILYRRVGMEGKNSQTRDKPEEKKTWYCRNYNKEGCLKTSPHTAWFGFGPSATKKQVVHACAACLLKARTIKEHPENHQACPYRD